MIFLKHNIKRSLKSMSRWERGRKSVKNIMSDVKGPTTFRRLKKTLKEEGLSRMARKRILGTVRSEQIPPKPVAAIKTPPVPKIETAKTPAIPTKTLPEKSSDKKPAEWIKDIGRQGIKFEKERKPVIAQKFSGQTNAFLKPQPQHSISEKTLPVSPRSPQSQQPSKPQTSIKNTDKTEKEFSAQETQETKEEKNIGKLLEERMGAEQTTTNKTSITNTEK